MYILIIVPLGDLLDGNEFDATVSRIEYPAVDNGGQIREIQERGYEDEVNGFHLVVRFNIP
jgi:hypothetical protein